MQSIWRSKNIYNWGQAERPARSQYDVIIIGSGAGGGITAEILARSGLDICIVEAGPLKTADDFKMREKDAYGDLYQEVAARQSKDKGVQIMQGRCVGGSTTVNWTSSFRTPDHTLDYWQHEFGLSQLNRDKLAPYFSWVEERLGIRPWPLPPNNNNELLAIAAQKLGWHYAVIPRNVRGCANLGYCGMGCPINAKQSMLVTTIPSAVAAGATLIHNASVSHIEWQSTADPRVNITASQHTETLQLSAKTVVLAAGAIGSPAIALRSGLQQINSRIGQRTFLHPVTASIARMPRPVDAFSGAPQSIYSDHFLWRDGVSGEAGYKLEVPPLHPVIATSLLKLHGKAHQRLSNQFNYFHAQIALLRDGFHPELEGGRVLLDDHDYPQLDYPLTPTLFDGLRHALLRMAEAQFAVGVRWQMPLHMDAKPVRSWQAAKQQIQNLAPTVGRWQVLSAHVMGGMGMAASPDKGVTDEWGRIFGAESLRVIDGSLFPTSLGVNPQLTIYTLATKLSRRLAIDLGGELPQDLALPAPIE